MKICLIPVIALLAAASAQGAVSLILSDNVGAPNSTTIAPGESFSVTLTLTSTAEATTGISYLLAAFGPGSGLFQVTARDVTGSAFGDLVTSDGIAFSAANAVLDPTNDNDLGGLADPASTGIGTYLVATLTIQSLPGITPGNYVISTSDALILDDAFDSITVSQPTYEVVVVPEPSAAAALSLGLAALVIRRRR